MKKNLKKLLAFFCALVLLVTACFTENAMNQAQAETETSAEATSTEPKPVELYGFENVTLNDFVHYTSGSTMGETDYVYGVDNTYKLKSHNDFNKKLFTAWVKFTNPDTTQWWLNRICIGGTASNGWGLSVALTNNGNSLIVSDADTKIASPKFERTIEGTEVGVDSFLSTEFLLQIGYEYLAKDADGTVNDVLVLVYVNGKVALKEVIADCDMTALGEYVRFSLDNQACTIGVKLAKLSVKPVELDGFTNVTPSDVVYEGTSNPMEEKTYQGGSTSFQGFNLKDGTDFDKKLFTAWVKFNPSNYWMTRLCIGGSWTVRGLAACVTPDGNSLIIQDFANGTLELSTNFVNKTITTTEAGVDSFKDEFLLQMGYEYLDNNVVRVLVYVNGNKVLDESISNCNMEFLGNFVGTYTETADDGVSIRSFKSEAKPVTLSSHDTVTISDFKDSAGNEMEAKGYDYDSVTPTSSFSLKDGSTAFNEKLLSMKVKFGHRDGASSSYENRLAIPAADGSNGIFVYINAEGQLCIDNTIATVHYERIDCATAGVTSFKDNPFILQMSFKDTTNGLELGVYINGKLCETYYWTEAKTSDYSSKLDLTRSLKDAFIVVSDVDTKEFPADPAIMPDSSFEKITFGSFGLLDGTYNEEIGGLYGGSLNKKVLCGKIKLVGDSFFTIRLGGKDTTWDTGLYLAPLADGKTMEVKWLTNGVTESITNFTSDIAGVEFIGETAYDLMISMEVVDVNSDGVNDVRFGVWFDNKLYGDTYYEAKGVGDNLGNRIGMNPPTNGTITLNSVKEYLPQPDESYDKVTFQHFAIKDGTYDTKGGDWVFTNTFKKKDNLDGIVLCGDIKMEKADSSVYVLSLGGRKQDGTVNPWNGILLWTDGSNMTLSAGSGNQIGVIAPANAGVGDSFLDKTISLMWSVKFLDHDGGGTANDIQVELWFDGFLYKEGSFYYDNYGTADTIGNTFAVCCQEADNAITINSSSEIMNLPGEEFGKLSLPDFVHNGTLATGMMESGTYVADTSDEWLVLGNAKCDTLDKKVVSFDVLQSGIADDTTSKGTSYRIRIGGAGGEWYGLLLNTGSDGKLSIAWCTKSGDFAQVTAGHQTMFVDVNDATYNNQPAVSSFVNETFNLMVSMELVDANGNDIDDVKVRIWFNKIPFVYDGMDSFTYLDCADSIGNNFTVGLTKNASEKAFVSLRTDAEYQSNPNYYEDIAEYRQGSSWSDFTHPEKDGYTFSGWYEEDTYKTPIEPTQKSGKAYAKFIDDEVLTVKAQVQLDKTTKEVPTDSTSLRFVTTVDSLKYRQIAFKFAIQKEGDTYYSEYSTASNDEDGRKVYSQLYCVGADKTTMEIEPTAFSWASQYFKAWTLSNIENSNYDRKIMVKPYWITLDGTYVYGPTRYVSVNESTAGADAEESKAVSMAFLGENTMPIGGAALWPASDDDSILFPDYVTEEYFEMFADAGVNLITHSGVDYNSDSSSVMKQLQYGEKYGIGVFVEDSKLLELAKNESDGALTTRLQEYAGSKAFSGIHVIDEPGVKDQWGYNTSKTAVQNKSYDLYTGLAEKLKTKYLAYSNMYPIYINYNDVADDRWSWITDNTEENIKKNYTSYVETVSTNMQNDVLSWDFYPFEKDHKNKAGTDYDYSLYFWNLDLIRTKAQTQEKPFWAFIQAGSQWNNEGNAMASEENYYPSESQFDWNVNTSLAFGAQGIQYFPLVQTKNFATDNVNAEWDFERNGLISVWGGKTPWYYYAQEMNKQIAAIDEVLMNSVNKKVVVPTSGNANSYTSGLTGSVATSYDKLKSVSGDAMVGYFNYQGKTALYVVNNQMYDVGETTATQDITLTFDADYKNIKKTENAKTTYNVATSGKSLTLADMEPGEGILLIVE